MRRRWLFGLAGLLAIVVVLAATLPWWLGIALKGSVGRFGASFRTYERNGYGRFVLKDVEVRRGNVVVTAASVEADTPLRWGMRRLRGSPGFVRAGEWTVVVSKSTGAGASRPSGWLLLRSRLWRIAGELDRWLPRATVGPGTVRWPNGELAVNSARWESSTLYVHALRFRNLHADGTLEFSRGDDLIRVTVEDQSRGLRTVLDSRGTQVFGNVMLFEQRAAVSARFSAVGWTPPEASLNVESLNIPAERLKLGAGYSGVRGHARADWRIDHFFADVSLKGEPVAGNAVPPVSVTLRGRGDPLAFVVEAFRAELPGVFTELSAPVTVERSGTLRETVARLVLNADLAKQPWFTGSGIITGQARVTPSPSGPLVDFGISGENLKVRGTAIRRAEAKGRFSWPQLTIEEVSLRGAEGEVLAGKGGWDFRARQVIESSLKGTLRSATLGRWLPANLAFEQVAIEARGSGPARELVHSGTLDATGVRFRTPSPATLSVQWKGRGPRADPFSVEASLGQTRLSAEGVAEVSGITLSALSIRRPQSEPLSLVQPARVNWRPALTVDALQLSGGKSALEVAGTWSRTGRIALTLRDISSRWLSDFVKLPGPEWTVMSFALSGNWDQGPMTYSAAGGISTNLVEGRVAELNFAATGDEDGLKVDALRAVEGGNTVISATGKLPLRIAPGAGQIASMDTAGGIALNASTVPNAAFWRQIAEMTGLEFRNPQLSADVTGTWGQPRGQVILTAERAAMDPKRFERPLPAIDGLDVALTAEPDGVRLDRFQFAVERQSVHVSGRLPMPGDAWREILRRPVALVQKGVQLRIEVPEADVSSLSRFLPAALAPAGRIQADLRIDGGSLGGFVRLRNAASRPLGPLGVLQGVSADVDFADRRVILRQVSATSGGQPVTLAGTVDLPIPEWLAGREAQPVYDVTLQGKNVPFVRQAGLLVRGDLDLMLKSPSEGGAAPRISGKVILRDSLFLADVRAYLPSGGGAGPSRRPPYFSVDTAPLNTWVLDVEITGTRFMRVRMPVFAGVTSARFNLGGALGDPRILGVSTIDEGQVLMPFATFTVRQGIVRLTEENPFEPMIYLRGTGRHFGYDLTMEVTGKASGPKIAFTSSPALDSDQVLLMVMTGAAPSNELNTSLAHRAVQIGAFFGQSLIGSLTGTAARPDRLSFETGEKISRQGRETYAIEYELSDRWTATGEYDEFDEYNVGFKWRVAPKKKER